MLFSSAAEDFLVVNDWAMRVSLAPVPDGAPSCAMGATEVVFVEGSARCGPVSRANVFNIAFAL